MHPTNRQYTPNSLHLLSPYNLWESIQNRINYTCPQIQVKRGLIFFLLVFLHIVFLSAWILIIPILIPHIIIFIYLTLNNAQQWVTYTLIGGKCHTYPHMSWMLGKWIHLCILVTFMCMMLSTVMYFSPKIYIYSILKHYHTAWSSNKIWHAIELTSLTKGTNVTIPHLL